MLNKDLVDESYVEENSIYLYTLHIFHYEYNRKYVKVLRTIIYFFHEPNLLSPKHGSKKTPVNVKV